MRWPTNRTMRICNLHQHLLEQAEQLAKVDTKRPRQANLRRAVSASYYGLFHYLVDQSCGAAVGRAQADTPYRRVLARSFEHSAMKTACKSFGGGMLKEAIQRSLPSSYSIDEQTRQMATAFIQLHELRHAADYDLTRSFSRAEVTAAVDVARSAIEEFERDGAGPERRFFLACLWAYSKLVDRR